MQAIGRQLMRAPDGAPIHYERHRPEQTTLHRLVQQHAASFIAHADPQKAVTTSLRLDVTRRRVTNLLREPRKPPSLLGNGRLQLGAKDRVTTLVSRL